MQAEMHANTSNLKTDLVSPFTSYYVVGVFKVVTGSLNPLSAMLMSTISSIVDIAAVCITNGSQKECDIFFRLATTTVIPFTVAIALGLPFPAAVTITVINMAIRILFNDYVFSTPVPEKV